MVRRGLSRGRRDEGKSRQRISRGRGIARSRHNKELVEKAFRRKIKVKLTQGVSEQKEPQEPIGSVLFLATGHPGTRRIDANHGRLLDTYWTLSGVAN